MAIESVSALHCSTGTSKASLTRLVGSEARKAAEEGKVNLEDQSDDNTDDESEEDSASEEEEEEEEDSEEEEVEDSIDEESTMSTPSKKKTPKKKTPAKTDTSIDDVTAKVSKMKVDAAVPMFSMDYKFPYIMKVFKEDLDEMVGLDLFVHTLPKEYFIPDVVNDGTVLAIRTQVPQFFPSEGRVLATNGGNGFNHNTYEAQAFKDVCEEIDERYNFMNSIFDTPMKVKLPFKVEERIVNWEVQAYPNDLGTLTDDLGAPQYHCILSVKLMKLKSKRRTAGGFRIIGAAPMNEEDEEN